MNVNELRKLKFGLQEQKEDERDYTAETLGISPTMVQSEEHVELYLPNIVYHQGQTDMCTAFASTMMMTMLNSIVDENGMIDFPLEFSQADIYAQKNTPNEGAQLRDILNQLKNRGVALDLLYNYKGTFDECKQAYQEHKNVADAQAELGRISYYYQAKTEEDILSALNLGKPIFASLNVYDDFFPDSQGYIHSCSGQYLGGHAILIVGLKTVNGKVYVKILNSWGRDWSHDDSGCAWVPYEMITLAYVPVDSNMKVSNVYFKMNTDYYVKNGERFYMTGLNDVPVYPVVIDGRTMLPVKFVADALGAETEYWDDNGAENAIVYITK